MRQKEKVKAVRDRIIPLLLEHAQLRILETYKPGLVEPTGQASASVKMSKTRPIESIRLPSGIPINFYAYYYIIMPLKPLISFKHPSELLQKHMITKIHDKVGERPKIAKAEETLIMFIVDFYVTRDGQVWHEESENAWTKVFQLPPSMVQASYLNLTSKINLKYIV